MGSKFVCSGRHGVERLGRNLCCSSSEQSGFTREIMAALWLGERSERGEMEREERRLSARSHGLNQCVVKEESSAHSNSRNGDEVWGEEVAAGGNDDSVVGPT